MLLKQDQQSQRVNRLRQGLSVGLSLVLILMLCHYLYHYDNQYTNGCPQPSDGILDLRHAMLDDKSQPYHLQQDWEFYPGVLLTPSHNPDHFVRILRTLHVHPHNLQDVQGTYRLTILLPDTPLSYALKLPSTFHKYKLYVNDELILPGGDSTRQLFKEQILTIWASGKVEILLQYVDETGIHNGLSSPPIFGRPLKVYTLTEYHQFFLGVSVAILMLTLLLSVNIYCGSRQPSSLAVIVLCLAAIAYLSYPLVRSEIKFPVYPWHQLRILLFFLCHAMVYQIYSLHFGWRDRLARFWNRYSMLSVVVCGVIMLFVPALPQEDAWWVFYAGVRLLQWGAILCGISLSVRMVVSGSPGLLMGAASVTVWIFMLVDLVTPDFSPIIFSRFPEMGIVCYAAISILIEYSDVASAHHFRMLYSQKMTHAEQLLKLEEQHYAQLSKQVEETIRTRHDLRQHMRVIRTLLDEGDADATAAYLEQYIETVQPMLTKTVSFFQVPVVDALISHYWTAAEKRGATMEVKGQLSSLPQSVYVDFCSILGNLLENALEALDREAPDRPKWIRLRCEAQSRRLILEVVNSNSTLTQMEEHRFHSAKRDELGVGTLSVSIIAKQYGGYASFSPEEGCFTARVLLPLPCLEGGIPADATSPPSP